MRNILVNVNEQRLYLNQNEFIVEGSLNYLQLKVNFISENWKKCNFIIASYEHNNGTKSKEIVENNIAEIKGKLLKTGVLKISLEGYSVSQNRIITTNYVELSIRNTLTNDNEYEEINTYDKIFDSYHKAYQEGMYLVLEKHNGEKTRVKLTSDEEFRGEYNSYDELIATNPTGEAGYYAYVKEEDKLVMYIWSGFSNTWELFAGGGGDSEYTNEAPTTATLGGIEKGSTFDKVPYSELFNMLLYPYVEFDFSVSTNPDGGTYESGTTQTIDNVTVDVQLGSKPINGIVVKQGNQIVASKTDGITEKNTISLKITVDENYTYNYLTVEVTDGETTKTKNSKTFDFVYPYYYGKINADESLNETLIKSLNKQVVSKSKKEYNYELNQEKAVIAYNANYGDLSSIKDQNGFEYLETFEKQYVTIDVINYVVYVLENASSNTMTFTFTY
jgi:hypothetical protein